MRKNQTLVTDCLVPDQCTGLQIKDLPQGDLKTLNSVPLVQIDSSKHGHFALSDLLLEMG